MGNKIVRKHKSKGEKSKKKNKAQKHNVEKEVPDEETGEIEKRNTADKVTSLEQDKDGKETLEDNSQDAAADVELSDKEIVIKQEHYVYASSFCERIIKEAFEQLQIIFSNCSKDKLDNIIIHKEDNITVDETQHNPLDNINEDEPQEVDANDSRL